jgi:hypothetical protein
MTDETERGRTAFTLLARLWRIIKKNPGETSEEHYDRVESARGSHAEIDDALAVAKAALDLRTKSAWRHARLEQLERIEADRLILLAARDSCPRNRPLPPAVSRACRRLRLYCENLLDLDDPLDAPTRLMAIESLCREQGWDIDQSGIAKRVAHELGFSLRTTERDIAALCKRKT